MIPEIMSDAPGCLGVGRRDTIPTLNGSGDQAKRLGCRGKACSLGGLCLLKAAVEAHDSLNFLRA